jgi:methyl-accepting chemotaxis protein
VSEVQASPATGRPVCLITTPILQNGALIGIAGTPLELKGFCDSHVRDVKVGNTGYIAITDSRGTTLAHKNPDLVLKFNMADQDWGRQALAQKNGSLEYTFSGAARVAHFATYPRRGWLVMAILPKSEIAQQLSGIRETAALLGLGALALVIAVTRLLTGSLIRSVRRIAMSLSSGAEQTTGAAAQVSSASQRLAEGASEQAASLEETSSSLEESATTSARKGSQLTVSTQEAVKRNIQIMAKVKTAVDAIAAAVKEQTQGISQINKAVGQMDKVTQGNAASAEECASAAEELNAQAETMKQSVAELVQLVVGKNGLALWLHIRLATKLLLAAQPALAIGGDTTSGWLI